ncbi:unnamed protein product, partial [Mesorhabditis spiculigera]
MPAADEYIFVSRGCNNETIEEGYCNGLPICGYCYGGGTEGPVASWQYELFNLVVIGFILPLIGIFGLFGDAVSAFIYSRREMQSSLNVYLCALAISDMIVIVTAFFLFFIESMRKRSLFASRVFAQLAPYMFPVGLTAQTLSVFLTVAAAFDCLVLVAMPRFRARFCKIQTALKNIGLIFCLACLYNSPHIFEIYTIDCWSLVYRQKSKDVCPTELRQNVDYLTIYYAYLYTIVMAAGPVILLFIINSAIVIFIRKETKKGHPVASESDTLTLVLVVALFVSCNILPLTVNFLELFLGFVNTYMIDLSNLMVVVNSSCNFLIYYAFGANFRRTLKGYFKNFVRSKGRTGNPLLAVIPQTEERLI